MAQGSKQRIPKSFDQEALLWAGGLFVGEGSVYAIERPAKRRPGFYRYPCVGLKMLDGRSVARFAKGFGLEVRDYPHSAERRVYLVGAAGNGAVRVLRALYPYLEFTSKGDQALQVLAETKSAFQCESSSLFGGRDQAVPSLSENRRRPRAWLLDTEKFEKRRVTWASGLFAAEGYAFIAERRARDRTLRYPGMSITMFDPGAIETFGSVFFVKPYSYERPEQSARFHRVQTAGSSAEAGLRAMYPHLLDTDKGDQIKGVFGGLGLELRPDGGGDTWKRENGLRGRTLSAEHRAHISVGQARRWARERGRHG